MIRSAFTHPSRHQELSPAALQFGFNRALEDAYALLPEAAQYAARQVIYPHNNPTTNAPDAASTTQTQLTAMLGALAYSAGVTAPVLTYSTAYASTGGLSLDGWRAVNLWLTALRRLDVHSASPAHYDFANGYYRHATGVTRSLQHAAGWQLTQSSVPAVPTYVSGGGTVSQLAPPYTVAVVPGEGFIQTVAGGNALTHATPVTGAWSAGNCTLTANQDYAPNGVVEASTIQATASALSGVSLLTAELAADLYAYSVHVKPLTGSGWVWIQVINGGSPYVRAWFNVSTGAVGTVNGNGAWTVHRAYALSCGGGWWRLTLVYRTDSTLTHRAGVYLSTGDGAQSAATGNSASVWGAQISAGPGSVPTLLTSGSAVSYPAQSFDIVTPAPDSGDWTAYARGTFYAPAAAFTWSPRVLVVSDGTSNNLMQIIRAAENGLMSWSASLQSQAPQAGGLGYYAAQAGEYRMALFRYGGAFGAASLVGNTLYYNQSSTPLSIPPATQLRLYAGSTTALASAASVAKVGWLPGVLTQPELKSLLQSL